MTSKVDMCNIALSRLGDVGNITQLNPPIEQKEKVFSKWYDLSRRSALKKIKPSFALKRALLPLSDYKPPFGYNYAYLYPNDCLQMLGIGNLDESENNYAREGEYIFTDEYYPNGLEVRYIRDIEDLDKFDCTFLEVWSYMLARDVAPEICDKKDMLVYLENILSRKISEAISIDYQENKPIIKTQSRLLSGYKGYYRGTPKK